jgi:hypothetical protein
MYPSFLRRLVPFAALLCFLGTRGALAQQEPKLVAKAKATDASVTVIDFTADGKAVRDVAGDRARARQAQFVNSDWNITTEDVTISQGNQVLLRARAFPAADEQPQALTYWVVAGFERNQNQLPAQLLQGTIHLDQTTRTRGFARLFLTTFEAGNIVTQTVLEMNLQVTPQ